MVPKVTFALGRRSSGRGGHWHSIMRDEGGDGLHTLHQLQQGIARLHAERGSSTCQVPRLNANGVPVLLLPGGILSLVLGLKTHGVPSLGRGWHLPNTLVQRESGAWRVAEQRPHG